MDKVLIIGGAGFIGMNITQNLKEHGIEVAVYDIKESSICDKNYIGNIIDDDNFDSIISRYNKIIYLITTISPKKSMDEPMSAYIKDVPLLIKTLDSCLNNNIKRVIFSSSGGTIYGDNNGVKSKETDYNEPINHYAVCKLTCEKILDMYNKLYGMENISLRISNPFGRWQNPSSGVGAITAFAKRIKDDEKLMLFGNGEIVRDFIDVEEVAEAFYLATKWNFDKNVVPIFNVGSGQGLSIKQAIEIISSTLEKEPQIEHLPERDFDVKYNVLDITKIKDNLGFKPCDNEVYKIKEYIKNNFK